MSYVVRLYEKQDFALSSSIAKSKDPLNSTGIRFAKSGFFIGAYNYLILGRFVALFRNF